jgi:hypothetical protein
MPLTQVRPNCFVQYLAPVEPYQKKKSGTEFQKGKKNCKTYTGELTEGAKKRLSKSIDIMIQQCCTTPKYVWDKRRKVKRQFTMGFITLTIPPQPGKDLFTGKQSTKELLEPFLRVLREHYKSLYYVWKAELQARGEIHYHILTDVFVDLNHCRQKFVAILKNAGIEHYNKQSCFQVESVYDRGRRKDGTKKNVNWYMGKMVDIAIKQKFNDEIDETIQKRDAAIEQELALRIPVCQDYSETERLQMELRKELQNLSSIGGKVWDCSLPLKKASYLTIAHEMRDKNEVHSTEKIMHSQLSMIMSNESCSVYRGAMKSWEYLTGYKPLLLNYIYLIDKSARENRKVDYRALNYAVNKNYYKKQGIHGMDLQAVGISPPKPKPMPICQYELFT